MRAYCRRGAGQSSADDDLGRPGPGGASRDLSRRLSLDSGRAVRALCAVGCLSLDLAWVNRPGPTGLGTTELELGLGRKCR